jgi:small subunit ribosomal protein S4
MARYTGSVCRLCRRAGEKLFLKGERCFTPKCAVERRRKPPGEQPQRRRRASDRGVQLREKQKMRVSYGILERQFRGYFEEARKVREATGEVLTQLLERRLDNVIFRLDFAESRSQARQFVRHGHITVGGRKVNIPSYRVKTEEVIAWRPSSQDKEFVKTLAGGIPRKSVPEWLSLDTDSLTGKVLRLPLADDAETIVDTRLIVEYYSK